MSEEHYRSWVGYRHKNQMQSIQLYSQIITTLEAINAWGDDMARSGMYGCQRVEQGRQLAMICYTNNMSPDEVMARYDIIDGKLRKKSTACLADFRKKGGKHRWIEFTNTKATLTLFFEGEELTVTYTIDDAKLAGLVRPNSNWVKTPGNMLRARVITMGVTMLAPEVVASGTVEEDDPMAAPAAPGLNLAPPPAAPKALPSQTVTANVIDLAPSPSTEEATEAAMGLAPVQPAATAPSTPKATPPAPAKKKSKFPAALDPLEPEEEEPVPPAGTIEPEVESPPEPEPPPQPGRKQVFAPPPKEGLDQETIEEMGRIFQGHYVEVANWMIRETWIPPSTQEIKTEAHAALHLQHTLPHLTRSRAKKVLAKKLAFMRAIEEINP